MNGKGWELTIPCPLQGLVCSTSHMHEFPVTLSQEKLSLSFLRWIRICWNIYFVSNEIVRMVANWVDPTSPVAWNLMIRHRFLPQRSTQPGLFRGLFGFWTTPNGMYKTLLGPLYTASASEYLWAIDNRGSAVGCLYTAPFSGNPMQSNFQSSPVWNRPDDVREYHVMLDLFQLGFVELLNVTPTFSMHKKFYTPSCSCSSVERTQMFRMLRCTRKPFCFTVESNRSNQLSRCNKFKVLSSHISKVSSN